MNILQIVAIPTLMFDLWARYLIWCYLDINNSDSFPIENPCMKANLSSMFWSFLSKLV